LAGVGATSAVGVTISWGVTAGVAPICSEAAQVSVNGGHTWRTLTLGSSVSTSAVATMPPGTLTAFRVQATGCDGVTSGWSYTGYHTAQVLQESSSSIEYGPGWTSVACALCSLGAQEQTGVPGASSTVSINAAQSAALVLSTGPTDGKASVSVDGNGGSTVSAHATKVGHLKYVYAVNWGAVGNHSLKVTNLATSGHPGLQIDAVVLLQ
jgi:hypothetical protein